MEISEDTAAVEFRHWPSHEGIYVSRSNWTWREYFQSKVLVFMKKKRRMLQYSFACLGCYDGGYRRHLGVKNFGLGEWWRDTRLQKPSNMESRCQSKVRVYGETIRVMLLYILDHLGMPDPRDGMHKKFFILRCGFNMTLYTSNSAEPMVTLTQKLLIYGSDEWIMKISLRRRVLWVLYGHCDGPACSMTGGRLFCIPFRAIILPFRTQQSYSYYQELN